MQGKATLLLLSILIGIIGWSAMNRWEDFIQAKEKRDSADRWCERYRDYALLANHFQPQGTSLYWYPNQDKSGLHLDLRRINYFSYPLLFSVWDETSSVDSDTLLSCLYSDRWHLKDVPFMKAWVAQAEHVGSKGEGRFFLRQETLKKTDFPLLTEEKSTLFYPSTPSKLMLFKTGLFLLLLLALGWSVSNPLGIAPAFLIGALLCSWGSFLWSLTPLSLPDSWFTILLVFTGLIFLSRWLGKKRPILKSFPKIQQNSLSWLKIVVYALALSLIGLQFFRSLTLPPYDTASLGIWGIKAQAIATEKSFPFLLLDTSIGNSHQAHYPLGFPFLLAIARLFSDVSNEWSLLLLPFAGWLIASLAVYSIAHKMLGHWLIPALVAILISLSSVAARSASLLQADTWLCAWIVTASGLLWQTKKESNRKHLCAWLLLAGAGWWKLEGLLWFGVIGLTAILTMSHWKRDSWMAVFSLSIVCAPWYILSLFMGHQSLDFSLQSFTLLDGSVSQVVSAIWQAVKNTLLESQDWWMLLFLPTLYFCFRKNMEWSGLAFWIIPPLIVPLLLCASFLFSNHREHMLEWHLQAVPRLLLPAQYLLSLTFIFCLSQRKTKTKTNHENHSKHLPFISC